MSVKEERVAYFNAKKQRKKELEDKIREDRIKGLTNSMIADKYCINESYARILGVD